MILFDTTGQYLFSPDYDSNVKSINHRGYSTIAPENTLPAYVLSKKKGFRYVETDVSWTSDGIPVLLHDNTINRTARNADGSEISTEIEIGSITYSQARQYDFGIWKGAEYEGTKIPLFRDFIRLCKNIGVHPYIELKSNGATQERIEELIDIVKAHGMSGKVTWMSYGQQWCRMVKTYDPKARVGYIANNVTADVIQYAEGFRTGENEVFINCPYSIKKAEVDMCIAADFPLEIWTLDSPSILTGFNPYITGVTSNSMIAGFELLKFGMA